VSSFPVLTAAVVRRLARGMTRLDSVTGGIAPSPHAGIGLNVIRAVASYAGKPVRVRATAAPTSATGWSRRGAIPSRRRGDCRSGGRCFRSSTFPDLQALPALWPELNSVWMGVGTAPEILHRIMNMFAWTVTLGLLRSLAPLATLMHAS